MRVELTSGDESWAADVKLPEPARSLNIPFNDLDVPVIDAGLPDGRYARRVAALAWVSDGEVEMEIPGFEDVYLVRDIDSQQAHLFRNRGIWERRNLVNYDYTGAWVCLICDATYIAAAAVSVRDGAVTSVASAEPGIGVIPVPERFIPLGDLFELLQDSRRPGRAQHQTSTTTSSTPTPRASSSTTTKRSKTKSGDSPCAASRHDNRARCNLGIVRTGGGSIEQEDARGGGSGDAPVHRSLRARRPHSHTYACTPDGNLHSGSRAPDGNPHGNAYPDACAINGNAHADSRDADGNAHPDPCAPDSNTHPDAASLRRQRPTPTPVPPTATPTRIPATPTAAPATSDPICVLTRAYSQDFPMAVIGKDSIPTGFDAINNGGCNFREPISSIRIELWQCAPNIWDGCTIGGNYESQIVVIPVREPQDVLPFPLVGFSVPLIDAGLPEGEYARRVIVFTPEGKAIQVYGMERVHLVHDPGSALANFLRHQGRWFRLGIDDYTYAGLWFCACPPEYTAAVQVAVLNGRIADVAPEDPAIGTVPEPERYLVRNVFDLLQDAITRNADRISVEYHERVGYPRTFLITYDLLTDEGTIGGALRDLTPLRP